MRLGDRLKELAGQFAIGEFFSRSNRLGAAGTRVRVVALATTARPALLRQVQPLLGAAPAAAGQIFADRLAHREPFESCRNQVRVRRT